MAETGKPVVRLSGQAPTGAASVSGSQLPTGWKITPVTNEEGVAVFQLFNAQGEYVASAISEAALWRRVQKRGLLPTG